MAPALQEGLVLGVVSEPSQQGLAGVVTHPGVGQTHGQGHESREVVWVELQTPGRSQDAEMREKSLEVIRKNIRHMLIRFSLD